jgi:chromosome segregation ATPase
MQRHLTAIAILSILMFAGSALAQPKSLRRRRGPPPHSRAHKPAPARGPSRMCEARQSILAQEEQRRDAYLADLTGIDAEMAQLRRQLEDLARRRSEAKRLADTYTSRALDAKASYDKDCAATQSCRQYDTLAGQLEKESKAIESQLGAVRSSIDAGRRDISGLKRRIEPLQREYQRLRCNNLVPGETAQSTIDRCSGIFSEWNRLQADLNVQNQRLPALKVRYEQLLAELRNIESRARGYEAYMAGNCKSSSKVATMRSYGQGGVRKRAENLGRELDSLIDEVTKLRGVRITVEPR